MIKIKKYKAEIVISIHLEGYAPLTVEYHAIKTDISCYWLANTKSLKRNSKNWIPVSLKKVHLMQNSV